MTQFLQLMALAACAAGALPAAASCYTVLGSTGRVVYQSAAAPVDLSRQLHETVPSRFPGNQLVFTPQDSTCTEVRPLPSVSASDIPEGITGSVRARSATQKASSKAPINLDNFFNDPNASGYGGSSAR